jgi:hypothetical protein
MGADSRAPDRSGYRRRATDRGGQRRSARAVRSAAGTLKPCLIAAGSEHEAPECQAAMQALLLVAKSGGPTMLARIGIMQALHRHEIREFDTDRKPHHWGKRKLARDR